MDGKPELEKVDTAMNSADVCTKSLPGNRMPRAVSACSSVCVPRRRDMGDYPNEWYLSRLDESCRCDKFEQSCDAESEGAC